MAAKHDPRDPDAERLFLVPAARMLAAVGFNI
jgi:hypothetical protein